MCICEINRLIRQNELLTHSVALGGELKGFVYKSKKGRLHMFIDNTLSPSASNRTKLHEGGHILKHLNKSNKLLGINNNNKNIESEADCFVHKENLHQLLAEM